MLLVTLTTASLAAGMLATSFTRLAGVGLVSARGSLLNHRWRRQVQNHLRREALHARMASELQSQTADTQRETWRVLEVVEMVNESDDCCSFYLQDPLGSLPSYEPGQFVTVRPALGGSSLPSRCYSLSDAPGLPWWRITVKRQTASNARYAASHSSLSNWLHDRVHVGDCLLVNGPYGEFYLDRAATTPSVLLAAGVGITPVLSMLKSQLMSEVRRSVTLFFQAQDAAHWPFGATVHSWCADRPDLAVHTYFSRATELPAVERGIVKDGKYDASHVLASVDDSAKPHYYLCGPDPWMAVLIDSLQAHGVEDSRIHSESFGGGSAVSAASAAAAPAEPWSLCFSRNDRMTATGNDAKSIWQIAKENNIDLPAACHSGACGTCRLKLLAGAVTYPVKPLCHVGEGEALACVAQPKGNVVVEA